MATTNVKGKKLVIVESPTKQKTISKILGNDFIVRSSFGHVRDLPSKDIGVDIEHDFKPTFHNRKKRSSPNGKLSRPSKERARIIDYRKWFCKGVLIWNFI